MATSKEYGAEDGITRDVFPTNKRLTYMLGDINHSVLPIAKRSHARFVS